MNCARYSDFHKTITSGYTYARYYPVEWTVGVTKPVLTRCQLTEVAGCVRRNIIIQLEDNAACILGVDGNIEL